MPIANTASASIANWSASNPATASFDCSGGNFLYVTLFGNSSMSAVSATYGGIALTLLHLTADVEGNKQAVLYLANPASGSNTLSVSRTSGANLSIVASAYSGVDTTAPIDDWSYDVGAVPTTSRGLSVTVGDANNWLLGSFRYEGTQTGTNTTQRVTSSVVLEAIWDTNGTIGSTGTVTETWTSGGFRIVGLTLTSLAAAAASPTPTTFSLTVNASKVAATLTDYPAYVDLSEMPAAFWAEVTNGGGDIRCYSDSGLTTELAREVVSCDTATDTGEMHVKVPSLTTSSVIYVTVDGTSTEPAVGATYGRNAVWSDYVGVWHMKDATTTTVADSTGNWDFTKTSSGNPAETTGQIDEGQNITADYLVTSASASLSIVGVKTVQTWIKFSSTTGSNNHQFPGLVSGINSGTQDASLSIGDTQGPSGRVTFYQFSGSVRAVSETTGASTGIWYQYHGTYDGSNIRLYKDGSLQATTSSGNSFNHGANARIQVGNSNDASPAYVADETRFRDSALSANWITTEYNNQSDVTTFWTIAEEGGGGGVTKNAVFFGGGM